MGVGRLVQEALVRVRVGVGVRVGFSPPRQGILQPYVIEDAAVRDRRLRPRAIA